MKPATARHPRPSPAPRVGLVVPLSHTYEMQALTGYPIDNNPHSRWVRGEVVRSTAPRWSGPSAIGYYQWDPTDPNGFVNPRS